MVRVRPLALCLAAALIVARPIAPAGQGAYDAAAARTLSGSILDGDHAFQYLRALTATFGPRLAGSPAYEAAAAWASGQFRSAGLTDAALEPFVLQRGWQRVSARARLVSPTDQPLHVASLGWMPSTPDGGIEAEVALVVDLDPAKVAAQA